MWLVDFFSTYLFGLKYVAILIAICIFISSLDDLVIDIAYWGRYLWRHFVIFKRHDYLDVKELYVPAEKPLAIMIPAWNETGVIGNMAQLAASTPRHPCLVLADRCRAKVQRCDHGAGFAACARARGCINRYEATCGPWWTR